MTMALRSLLEVLARTGSPIEAGRRDTFLFAVYAHPKMSPGQRGLAFVATQRTVDEAHLAGVIDGRGRLTSAGLAAVHAAREARR